MAVSLHAGLVTWTNSSGGDWSVPANWKPNQVPDASDDVAITSPGTYNVNLNGDATVASLNLGGSSGMQTLAINGPTLTLNGASYVDNNGILVFGGGTIAGPGSLTVGGRLEWSGGTMAHSGATVISREATLAILGSAEKILTGRAVTNQGTVLWSGTGSIRSKGVIARFYNELGGVFEVENDATYLDDAVFSGGAFYNAGRFRKIAGTGTTTINGIDFINTGTVETLSGRLSFPDGTSSSGVFLAGAGATNLLGSSCTFADGSVFGGEGQNRLENATATLDGAITVTNLIFASGTWLGTNTVSGTCQWAGGTWSSPGSTTLSVGSQLDITGRAEKILTGRLVTNRGMVVWSGTGNIRSRGVVGKFYNEPEAVFEAQNDSIYLDDAVFPGGAFHNAGRFRKTAGTGTTTFDGIPFHNSGTVSVGQGVLRFTGTLDLLPASVVEVQLSGTTPASEYGRITSSRALQLAGQLAVRFGDGYLPALNEQFDVLVAPILGQFQSYTVPPISPNVFINPVHQPNLVQLVAINPTPVVTAPPSFDGEGHLMLGIQGIVNQHYAVEATTDFEDWVRLGTASIPIDRVWTFVDEDGGVLPWRFYRVVFLP
ncbi:MAG: hypothetical protein H6827_10065 [Planctomycetes bacterium]|nr:hypothetical protein [Planctomycetota bacterium]